MGDSWIRIRRAVAGALFGVLALLAAPMARAADTVTVFAASSLTDALKAIGAQYTAETGHPVRFSFGASSAIARQIESGAPADLFFSADGDWMDYLQARSLIRQDTRRNLLGNRLVLIAPSDSPIVLKIAPGFPLARALGPRGRLSTGDPDSVPVGRYARSALMSLGVWNEVADRLAPAENVRSAMLFVDRGEAPLGVVYQTDAMVDPKVRVVDVFPAKSHLPIIYPAALTRKSGAPAAAFFGYVRGPKGQAVFRKFGFIIL
jgi:molybdate transport system substrate-binding protein